jgi:NADH:ubiquinone oxidoreductase subunit 2 (subunit N)
MYMQEPAESTRELPPLDLGTRAAIWTSAALTLILGIFPSLVLGFASRWAKF